ncbi:MAG: 16S rRNA (cytidine(1402)-2'-O)-methyltransferase [Pseudomonadota bacterium]
MYLVATPIGNASDITLRALDVLARADALAAEDTRQTQKLMEIHGIDRAGRRIVSYHDQNGAERRPQILGWLGEGKSVAYASDAGTPLIADPGYRLVEAAREAGHDIHAIPGASAVVTALMLAGLPTDRFLFAGFLPVKSAARRRELTDLASLRATLVFFESPRRLAECLADMATVLGETRIAVMARELTKTFEEIRRARLSDLAADLASAAPPRGEVVLLIGPPDAEAVAEDARAALDTHLTDALATQSVKEAARTVATRLSLPKREVYARALELTRK